MKRSHPRLLFLACALLLAGCDEREAAPAATEPSESRGATLPLMEPPLNRADLILAVGQAASDWAAGTDDLQRQRTLDGKRFELRLRFGCPGDAFGTRQWNFDEQERVLRLAVEPEVTAETALLAELDLGEFEAIEGFWLHREWLLDPVCPAPRAASAQPAGDGEPDEEGEPRAAASAAAAEKPAPAPQPMIGIAQFYTDQDSRTRRRETRAYESTVKLSEDQQPSTQGYDLVLSGRLARLPGGRVIACAGSRDTRPACLVSARFDYVAIARPDGQILAQWTSG